MESDADLGNGRTEHSVVADGNAYTMLSWKSWRKSRTSSSTSSLATSGDEKDDEADEKRACIALRGLRIAIIGVHMPTMACFALTG